MSGGLRFILVLLVIVEHLSLGITFGGLAVYSFFVLSGYWVTSVYCSTYFRKKSGDLNFFIGRAWRIFAPYWLFLLCYFFLSFSTFKLKIADVFILGSSLSTPLVPPIWSLDIELQFYLLLPLILPTIFKKKSLSFVISAILFLFLAISGPSKNLLQYLVFFSIGMMLYFNQDLLRNLSLKKYVLGSIILMVLIVSGSYFLTSTHHVFFENAVVWKSSFIGNSVLALVGVPVVAFCIQFKSGKMDRFFGDLSYYLYIVHWPFLVELELNGYAKTTLFIFGATLLLFALDRPFQNLRKRLL